MHLNSMIEGGTTHYLDMVIILASDFSHKVKGSSLPEYVTFEDVRDRVNINGSAFDLTRVSSSAVKAICKGETEGLPCNTKASFIDNEAFGMSQV